MNKLITLPVLTSAALMSAVVFAAEPGGPMPFTTATFTEVVNDVQLIPAGSTQGSKAAVQTVFTAPDLVKTGRKSRAQLTAADGTIARVGSNAVFAFDKDTRTVNLERGSILFHSPTGKGGGAIVTNSATASVIGTTIIVTATSDGGFKMFVLEGVAKVKYPDGHLVSINPGQMTFVLPGSKVSDGGSKGGQAGPVLNFDLGAMAKDSLLLGGFGSDLPSMDKIKTEVNAQDELIADGDLVRTGLVILGAGSTDEFFLTSQDSVQQAIQAANRRADDASRLADALAASYTYTGGPLPENFIFRTPVNIDPFGQVSGFIAGHLVINAPGFDLTALDGLPEIDVLGASASTLVIAGNVDFTGLDATRDFNVGGGGLVIADNAHVRVLFNNAPAVPASADFASFSKLTLNGVTLEAPGATLHVSAFGGDMTLTGATFVAGPQLNLYSAGNLSLMSATQGTADSVTVIGAASVQVGGSTLTALAGSLDVVSGGALTVAGSSMLKSVSGDLTLVAGTGALTVSDSTVKGGSWVRLQAAAGDVVLTNATVDALAGDLDIAAAAAANLSGVLLSASSNLTLGATGDVTVTGGSLKAEGGDLTVTGASVTVDALSANPMMAANRVFIGSDASGTVSMTDDLIHSAAFGIGGRFAGAVPTMVTLTNVGTTALIVNIAAQTLVLSGVDFAAGSSVLLRSANGTLNGLPGIVNGAVNFTGLVRLGGVDVELNGLLWVPSQNIGDPSLPIHILDLNTPDFHGALTDYAKTHDLTVDASFSVIPNAHKVNPAILLAGSDLVPAHSGALPAINQYDFQGVPTPHDALEVSGMLARHITVSGGVADLSVFDAAGFSHVDIVATGTLTWTGTLTVTGLNQSRHLEVRAAEWSVSPGAVLANDIAPDSDAWGDATSTQLVAVNNLTLPTVTISHPAGTVNVVSLKGNLVLTDTNIDAGTPTLAHPDTYGGSIRVQAAGDITITGGTLRSESAFGSCRVQIESGGTLTMTGANVHSVDSVSTSAPALGPVVVRAVALVRIDGGSLVGSMLDIGGPATAGDGTGSNLALLEMNNVALSGVSSAGIRMAAMTVTLENIDFPDFVPIRLRSDFGVLNIGPTTMTGAVNFKNNVRVGGASIMTQAGIDSKVWIEEPNSIRFNGGPLVGTPLEGTVGAPSSGSANIHIQKLGSPVQFTSSEG